MALQIWLPLNGNFNNQGLLNSVLSNTGITFNSSGKIGQCGHFNGSSYLTFPSPIITGETTEFTICCWAKFNSLSRTETLFASRTAIGLGISLFKLSSNQFRFDCGAQSTEWQISNYTIPINEWIHVCVTRNSSLRCLYVNGALISSTTDAGSITNISSTASVGESNIPIGGTPGNLLNGYINDFRFYNNCLSPKEIKLISQALILHYPLSQYDRERNLLSGTNQGKTNWGYSFQNGEKSVDSIVTEDGINAVKLTCTVASTGWQFTYYAIDKSILDIIKPNTAYTVSFDIKSNFSFAGSIGIGRGNATLWWVPLTGGLRYDGNETWQRINFVLHTNGLPDYANEKPVLYITGLGKVGYVIIKNLKLEIGNNPKPYWTPAWEDESSWFDKIEYDCSGYINNGITAKDTVPSWDSDSIRNRGCYEFSGSQFITCPKSAKVTDALTVSVWAYMDNWRENIRIISCTEGGGWNIESNGGYLSFPVYVSSVGYISAKSTTTWTSLSSGWHHFAGTYDGITAKLYLDNKNIATVGSGKTNRLPIGYNANNTIFVGAEAGNNATTPVAPFFTGRISDLRIYTTALSAQDIDSLYNVRVSLTDTGTVMTSGEIIE